MAEKGKGNKTKQPNKLVEKLRGSSYSPQKELFELLKSRCPEVFTEGKIDAGQIKADPRRAA
jgi:hypothetical protein